MAATGRNRTIYTVIATCNCYCYNVICNITIMSVAMYYQLYVIIGLPSLITVRMLSSIVERTVFFFFCIISLMLIGSFENSSFSHNGLKLKTNNNI